MFLIGKAVREINGRYTTFNRKMSFYDLGPPTLQIFQKYTIGIVCVPKHETISYYLLAVTKSMCCLQQSAHYILRIRIDLLLGKILK